MEMRFFAKNRQQGDETMSIPGLGTYNNSSYFFAAVSRSGGAGNKGNDFSFGGLLGRDDSNTTELMPIEKALPSAPYTRIITAKIKTEEMTATMASNGEMIYSYSASEQSFQICIESDGENKTYKITGIDKDGNSFERDFDPYEVDPENADLPEFSALCMYIRQTDETADLLADDYFKTDDILEKRNYFGLLGEFANTSIFDRMQSMLDCANKLLDEIGRIMDVRAGIEAVTGPFKMQMLTLDIEKMEEKDLPDVSAADLLALFEENNKMTSQDLKDSDDWRTMSDDEWDKMLEGIDKFIEAFRERLREMIRKQQEAALKAASEAPAELRSVVASQAALDVAANGFFGGTASETEEDVEAEPIIGEDSGVDHENNWTKKLKTDDQSILRTAKSAQKMEKDAERAFNQQIEIDDTVLSRNTEYTDPVTEKTVPVEIRYITNYSDKGISCKEIINEGGKKSTRNLWSLPYNSEKDHEKVADFINSFPKTGNLTFASQKDFWNDFLQDEFDVEGFRNYFESTDNGRISIEKALAGGRRLRDILTEPYAGYINNNHFIGRVYSEEELQRA